MFGWIYYYCYRLKLNQLDKVKNTPVELLEIIKHSN